MYFLSRLCHWGVFSIWKKHYNGLLSVQNHIHTYTHQILSSRHIFKNPWHFATLSIYLHRYLDRQIPYEARMSSVPAASHRDQIFEYVQPFKKKNPNQSCKLLVLWLNGATSLPNQRDFAVGSWDFCTHSTQSGNSICRLVVWFIFSDTIVCSIIHKKVQFWKVVLFAS